MKRLRLDLGHPEAEVLREAARILEQGGILALPTDTLYGLSCDPANRHALECLHRLKNRPASHRLPFLAADVSQVCGLASLDSELARRLVERFWPGPLTLVLPLTRPDRLARWDWGETIAIRVPACPAARELAREARRPIPATSANRHGGAEVFDPDRLEPALIGSLALLLDGGVLPSGPPSTLLDMTSSPPRLLRRGAVPAEALAAALGLPPSSDAPRLD
jgi:L-threonylcarbamoyladenylate synthase